MTKDLKLPDNVGVIAGNGDIPKILVDELRRLNRNVYVVELSGRDWNETVPKNAILNTYPEKVGQIFSFFKKNNVKEVVLIGGLSRPKITDLRPDLTGLIILIKILVTFLFRGDDALLRSLAGEIRAQGMTLKSILDYVPDLAAPKGQMTSHSAHKGAQRDISAAIDVLKDHGLQDKGQAGLFTGGNVVALEDARGTLALIANNKVTEADENSFLLKVSKPHQDLRLDLPTVGVETVRELVKKGYSGLVIESGKTLMVNREEMIAQANAGGLFILGIDIDDYRT